MDIQLGPINTDQVDPATVATDMPFRRELRRHQRQQQQTPSLQQTAHHGQASCSSKMRKRKAEPQDNERLSKRLGLLNLEKTGRRLYVPVETPSPQSAPGQLGHRPARSPSPAASGSSTLAAATVAAEDSMQLDDTKHKVYIYDLDAELSSTDENSESESSPTSGHGRVIFLPDIEKHLRRPRIPPAVLANREGELAGHNIDAMQMVLYNDPSSISVPREHDSVRKAILEARARSREKQKESQTGTTAPRYTHTPAPSTAIPQDFSPSPGVGMFGNGFADTTSIGHDTPVAYDDVDAMDTD
ncbi:hypothetical protein F4861DRAFT_546414 [Xylaria intraflava]|nr:hypothetical protein F4861DRAFT_546414 [Xylaria intraflava]